MPRYLFECSIGHETEIIASMKNPPNEVQKCGSCRRKARRVWNIPQANVFQEVVSSDITGEPVRISSARQRDRLLADNGLTMDRVSNPKPKRTAWERGLTFEKVKAKMEGRLTDASAD